MFAHEEHRDLNSEIANASNDVTRLLESYYRLADNKKLSQEQRDKLLEMAAEIKAHTIELQNMMTHEEPSKKKDESESESDGDDAEEKDEFLEGLVGDLPRKVKKSSKASEAKEIND